MPPSAPGAGGLLAEWCAPCKVLMPLLAKITESYGGALHLAKVNCDIEQELVMRFGIRSLPTVVLFKDGQPVDGFAAPTGIGHPRPARTPCPGPAAGRGRSAGRRPGLVRRGSFRRSRGAAQGRAEEDNSDALALILYARCLAERNELDDAQAVLDAVKGDEHKQALAVPGPS